MEQVVLQAVTKTEAGKGVARKLRAQGMVPGVVYGLGRETINLTVPRDELVTALRHGAGANTVFDLRIDGQPGTQGVAALLKAIQRHPLSRIPENVDFQWVSLLDRVHVLVDVVLEGRSPAQAEGASVDQVLHQVEISCMPLEIPDHLVMSIEGLQIGDVRTAAQLQLPEGAELLTDPEEAVVSCSHSVQLVEKEAAPVEGEIESLSAGEN